MQQPAEQQASSQATENAVPEGHSNWQLSVAAILALSVFFLFSLIGLWVLILPFASLCLICSNFKEIKGHWLTYVTLGVLLIQAILFVMGLYLLWVAIQSSMSMSYIKRSALAINRYHEETGKYPNAFRSPSGGGELSWRVHVLPYMDEQELYDKFHLDEPWDSEHNRTLIPLMPYLYVNPGRYASAGKTTYCVPVGPNTLFGTRENPRELSTIPDGDMYTIAVVEVSDENAVIWTRPQDWELEPKAPFSGLKKHDSYGCYIAAFAHCDSMFIDFDTDKEKWLNMLDPSDGLPERNEY